MTTAAVSPIRITPESLLREMREVSGKLTRGSQRLASYTEEQLDIATTAKDELSNPTDRGVPSRRQRWPTIDDDVGGHPDDRVAFIRERHQVEPINLLGVCQGGVFTPCRAGLFPEKLKHRGLTIAPVGSLGDIGQDAKHTAEPGSWRRRVRND